MVADNTVGNRSSRVLSAIVSGDRKVANTLQVLWPEDGLGSSGPCYLQFCFRKGVGRGVETLAGEEARSFLTCCNLWRHHTGFRRVALSGDNEDDDCVDGHLRFGEVSIVRGIPQKQRTSNPQEARQTQPNQMVRKGEETADKLTQLMAMQECQDQYVDYWRAQSHGGSPIVLLEYRIDYKFLCWPTSKSVWPKNEVQLFWCAFASVATQRDQWGRYSETHHMRAME